MLADPFHALTHIDPQRTGHYFHISQKGIGETERLIKVSANNITQNERSARYAKKRFIHL